LKLSFSLPLFGEAGGRPSFAKATDGQGGKNMPADLSAEVSTKAEPVNEISSDIFKYIPPVGKWSFSNKPTFKIMKTKKLTLSILPEKLGICHLSKNSPVPDWAKDISFCSICRTKDELSVILPQDKIPGGVLAEKNWRAFKVEGPLSLFLTGICASLAKPLADAEIPILYISTYETDYLLVEEKNLEKAKKVLTKFCDIK